MVRLSALQSDLLKYIIENGYKPGDLLPTIQEISQSMGVSVAKTRESLEIARVLGIVEVKPGRGTRVSSYRFTPAMTLSALYAVGQDPAHFEHMRQMRNALENAFWDEAVRRLTEQEITTLRKLVGAARRLLSREPAQVPAAEHRAFHLTIFGRLDNPFVLGVLESFWDIYEAFGMNVYMELDYHRKVWDYHERIVDAIEKGDIEAGRSLLVEHMSLLQHRASPQPASEARPTMFE
jgi:DNA-binding FadR family transcriptional regulator